MEQIQHIEQKMKRAGAHPDSVLRANPKRTFLDRVKVPRKFAIKMLCCKFRVSFYYCLFNVFLIDLFILVKDIIQIVEM